MSMNNPLLINKYIRIIHLEKAHLYTPLISLILKEVIWTITTTEPQLNFSLYAL